MRRDSDRPVRGRVLLVAGLVLLLDGLLMAACSWARAKAPAPARTGVPMGSQLPTLSVTEPLGLARRHWPLSIGVPFPRGALQDPSKLRLGDGASTPLQPRVLSRWPDGTVRWVLLDWQADLKAHQTRRFLLEPGTSAPPGRAVKARDRGDRIEVDTGPLQFLVPKSNFAVLTDVRLNGMPVTAGPIVSFFRVDGKRVVAEAPSAVTITEPGPLRTRIEMRGHYASRFDYVVRLDAFADQPMVRVFHTFEQHSPEAYTAVGQIGIDIPMAFTGVVSYQAGQEQEAPLAGTLPAKGFTLFQEDNTTLHVDGVPRRGQAAGWIDVHDATHGVAVGARFFWQEYPQSFQLQPRSVVYNLWAPQAAPAKVGMGAAKTHELVLYFHGKGAPSATTLAALTRPLQTSIAPEWVAASGALGNSVAPTPATAAFLRELDAGFRRYQEHADRERWDDSGQIHCADAARPTSGPEGVRPQGGGSERPLPERPRQGFYGMLNWGDWNFPGYHDTTKGCDAWGNLEYDMTQVLALAYAATADPRYYEAMVAAARHFMDVDRIYYQREHPNWIGMNHPKNPLHFSFELGGVDLGHTWTEGLLSYYYLTGDERGLGAARGIADYLVRRLRAGVVRGNPRQWGWPQIALVAAFDATGDEAYKQAALEYARNGMAAHPASKVADFKLGILAEGLAYTHAVTHESTIRDWLGQYAAAISAGTVADPRLLPAVAYVGRLSGNASYQRAALAAVPRLKFGDWGKPFTIAGRLGFSILSLCSPAAPPGGPR